MLKAVAVTLAAFMALTETVAAQQPQPQAQTLLCRNQPCKVRCAGGGPPLLDAEQVSRVDIALPFNGVTFVTVTGRGGGTVLLTTGTMCAFEGLSK